jgi:hypothetical protein
MPDFTKLFKTLLDFETSINAGKLDINEFYWTSSDLIWADTPSARTSFTSPPIEQSETYSAAKLKLRDVRALRMCMALFQERELACTA